MPGTVWALGVNSVLLDFTGGTKMCKAKTLHLGGLQSYKNITQVHMSSNYILPEKKNP